MSNITIRTAPSGIRRFENCAASHLYYKYLPRLRNLNEERIASFGLIFHQYAEHDFKEEVGQAILAEEKKNVVALVESCRKTVEARDYYSLPAVTEIEIEGKICDWFTLWGYPDRISLDLANGILYVVDFKTAAWPEPYKDLRQLMSYVLIIVRNRELREKIARMFSDIIGQDVSEFMANLTVDNIRIIIDYVKVDEVYPFSVSEEQLTTHENYCMSVGLRMRKLEEEFLNHRNFLKVRHTDGDCAFCIVQGVCPAYRIIRNAAVPESDEPMETIDTLDLVRECLMREKVVKNNEARVKALKRAILARNQEGDPRITEYFSVRSNKSRVFPTSSVLTKIVPEIVRRSAKSARFGNLADTGEIERELIEYMSRMLGTSLSKANIPEELLSKVKHLERVSQGPEFLVRK
jgi:hypothetical protein